MSSQWISVILGSWLGLLAALAAPANDDFANRVLLSGDRATLAFDLAGATSEQGELGALEDYWATVWWEWEAPISGLFEIAGHPHLIFNGWADWMQLRLFRGESLSNLVYLDREWYEAPFGDGPQAMESNFPSAFGFRAEAGVRYFFQAAAYKGVVADGELTLQLAPANNDFAGRKSIGGESFSEPFYGVSDRGEPGEPQFGEAPPGASVWWEWTCPSSGGYELTSFVGSRMGIFRGTFVSSLEPIAFDNGDIPRAPVGLSRATSVSFYAVQGEQLIFMVDSRFSLYSATKGELKLRPTPGLRPLLGSDAFALAETLSGSHVTSWVPMFPASVEPGEPAHRPGSVGSRWFRWLAPANGGFGVRIDSLGGIASVHVYHGSNLNTLTVAGKGVPTTNQYAQTSFSATAGEEYWIAAVYTNVLTSDSGWGTKLLLRLGPAMTNDSFNARIPISEAPYRTDSTTFGAVREEDEPSHGGRSEGASVWFTWQAPASGRYALVDSRYHRTPLTMQVYRGDELASLAPLQMQPAPPRTDGQESLEDRHRFYAEAGEQYAIAVETPLGEMRDISVYLQLSPLNDYFAERRILVGTVAEDTVSNAGATSDGSEPPNSYLSDTLWWGWSAPSDGICDVTLEALDQEYRPTLAVGVGDPPGAREWLGIAYTTNTPSAAVRLAVVAGTEYQIVAANGKFQSGEHPWSSLRIRISHHAAPSLTGRWHPSDWKLAQEGAVAWTTQPNVGRLGGEAAQVAFSESMAPGRLKMTLLGPGRISFWWKTSAQIPAGGDSFYRGGLTFVANRSIGVSISGDSAWKREEILLPEGPNELVWSTDGYFPFDLPAGAWLDQIEFQPTEPLKKLQVFLFPESVTLDFLYVSLLPYEIQSSADLIHWSTVFSHEELVRWTGILTPDGGQTLIPNFQRSLPRSTNEPVTFYRAAAP
jgi:hypothetical protein